MIPTFLPRRPWNFDAFEKALLGRSLWLSNRLNSLFRTNWPVGKGVKLVFGPCCLLANCELMGWGSWNPVSHLLWTSFLFRCHSHIEADIYRGSYWDPQLCKGCTALKPSQGLGSGEQHNQPGREHPGANSILTLALQVRKHNRVTGQRCSNFSHRFTLGNGVAKWVSGMPLGGAWGRWRQEGHSPRETLSSLATNYSLASLGPPCSLKASYPWTGVHGAKR